MQRPFTPVNGLVKLNLAVGGGCLLVVSAAEAFLLWRWYLTRRAKLIWWAALACQPQKAPGLHLSWAQPGG